MLTGRRKRIKIAGMIKDSEKILQNYIRAVNILDDYFEYRYLLHSQEENREYVIKTLDDLTKNLVKFNKTQTENKQQ